MEKQNTDGTDVENAELPKLPFKRLKRALEQIVDIALPFHSQLLNEQREAIENLKGENNLPALRQEQVKASKTVQLLKADLFELEQLNLQVRDEDQDQFHNKVRHSLKEAVETLTYFMSAHSDILGPFLNIEPHSITNPEEFPKVVCDQTRENTEEEGVSPGGVVQLNCQVENESGSRSQAWSYLRKELLEIHSLITKFASLVFTQQESIDSVQIAYMKQLAEMKSHEELLEKLKKLSNLLFNKSCIKCSLNATPAAMPSVFNSLDVFLHDVELTKNSSYSSFDQANYQSKDQKIHFVLPLSVNYLGQSILTVPYSHQDFASLKVASKLMSSKFLHGEIREKGGAYGGGASISKGGHFMFYSYRDPNVTKTLKSFSSGIDWLLESQFSDGDIDEAKLGVLGEIDAPVPPGAKGSLIFQEGISYEMKEEMRKRIFECTRENLTFVAQKYLKDSLQIGTALIGPENQFTKVEDGTWTIISNKL